MEIMKHELPKEETFGEMMPEASSNLFSLFLTGLSIFLVVYFMYTAQFGQFPPPLQRGLPFLIAAVLVFLMPLRNTSFQENPLKVFIGVFWVMISALPICYFMINYEDIAFRFGSETTLDIFMAVLGTLVCLEVCRRTIGWVLVILSIIAILYALLGGYVPGILGHKGFDIARVVRFTFLGLDGIWGIAIDVMTKFIFIFIIFGGILQITGGGKFFVDLALALGGKLRSGPAQCAVIGSMFFGMISGSAVANVVGVGTLTIPLMKSMGYSARLAAAIEAVGSTGGQLMPPIMAAAAFIMAEFTSTPYIKIAAMATIPGVLYYFSLAVSVHLEASKAGFQPLPKEKIPNVKNVLRRDGLFIIPIIALVAMLIYGFSPEKSAFAAIVITLVVSMVNKHTRVNFKEFMLNCEKCVTTAIPTFMSLGAIGIIIGMVSLTGLGVKFPEFVMQVSAGHLFVALLLTMISSLIMGMGLPTTACYILVAISIAPALVNMGVDLHAAHFFVFYFGIISMITPPVAIAAFAAAGLAGSEPFRTGFTASRLGSVAFIVPFFFVYEPALILKGPTLTIVTASLTAMLGVSILAAGTVGFLFRRIHWSKRIILIAAALLLITPGYVTDFVGICMAAIIIGIEYFQYKNELKKTGAA